MEIILFKYYTCDNYETIILILFLSLVQLFSVFFIGFYFLNLGSHKIQDCFYVFLRLLFFLITLFKCFYINHLFSIYLVGIYYVPGSVPKFCTYMPLTNKTKTNQTGTLPSENLQPKIDSIFNIFTRLLSYTLNYSLGIST